MLEVTTVADNEAVLHEDGYPLRVLDLEADTDYTVRGRTFRTLARPAGELLAESRDLPEALGRWGCRSVRRQ